MVFTEKLVYDDLYRILDGFWGKEAVHVEAGNVLILGIFLVGDDAGEILRNGDSTLVFVSESRERENELKTLKTCRRRDCMLIRSEGTGA